MVSPITKKHELLCMIHLLTTRLGETVEFTYIHTYVYVCSNNIYPYVKMCLPSPWTTARRCSRQNSFRCEKRTEQEKAMRLRPSYFVAIPFFRHGSLSPIPNSWFKAKDLCAGRTTRRRRLQTRDEAHTTSISPPQGIHDLATEKQTEVQRQMGIINGYFQGLP